MTFEYQKPFPLGSDKTEYKLISQEHVSTSNFDGETILKVEPEALELLARKAFEDVSFYLRSAHLEKVAKILDDPEASDNDRFVARTLLENSVTAADGELPTCQDTGTAIVMAKKGQRVWTNTNDAEALSKGIYMTYQEKNLRYSQVVPQTMFTEKNTGTNLPAQIDIYASEGDEYQFLFLAKGGGSANKSYLFQKTKSLLNEASLTEFIQSEFKRLGTAACPP